jgi:small subunit ribosomal protein S6
LMNVEATQPALEELTTNFKYNDAVIRNLVIRTDAPVTDESSIMKAESEQRERKARYDARSATETAKAPEKKAEEATIDSSANAESKSSGDTAAE